MTPSPAVALNLAQLVARLSQSRLSLRKESTVVPQCIRALAKMMAECDTLLRNSVAAFTLFRTCTCRYIGLGQWADLRIKRSPSHFCLANTEISYQQSRLPA